MSRLYSQLKLKALYQLCKGSNHITKLPTAASSEMSFPKSLAIT